MLGLCNKEHTYWKDCEVTSYDVVKNHAVFRAVVPNTNGKYNKPFVFEIFETKMDRVKRIAKSRI